MTTELPKRKNTRWTEYDYSNAGGYFITICTADKRQTLSTVGGDAPRKEQSDGIASVRASAPQSPTNLAAAHITVGGDAPRKEQSGGIASVRASAPQSPTHLAAAHITVGGDVLDAPRSAINLTAMHPSVHLLPNGKVAEKYINQLNEFYEDISVDAYVIMPNHIHLMLIVLENGASRTSPPTRQHSRVSQLVSTLKRFCNKEIGENIWQRHFHDHIIRNRADYEEHLKYIFENPSRWQYDELYQA